MKVLVCIKRVPDTGGGFKLTSDSMRVDTTNVGFAISPHEECAVEEAIRIIEKHGGSSTVLTLGPQAAQEQLREAIAKGINNAILLEAEDYEFWDPAATASAIAETVKSMGFDLLLFGNESADTCNYQVGVRVAYLLDLPCVTGIKALEIQNNKAIAKRETKDGWEVYEVPLPAVFTIREGINTPRHPSLRGIMSAKKVPIEQKKVTRPAPQLVRKALKKPQEGRQLEILGQGVEAVPKIIEKLREMGAI
ncbi:MAG: electron transfer flavoprotein subunit beta/FixA family protein [Candidatus Bipolaricaulota bacterium]|nr:electron transfer flavoprotein subunit beta/FixA family protein [Candidatus Bipolaricaulota bacterium]MDW8030626.1 electron transfer flavoprotein subunit beta/FixA family protein [Candidatus Bipolaricaulota bacterium]